MQAGSDLSGGLGQLGCVIEPAPLGNEFDLFLAECHDSGGPQITIFNIDLGLDIKARWLNNSDFKDPPQILEVPNSGASVTSLCPEF